MTFSLPSYVGATLRGLCFLICTYIEPDRGPILTNMAIVGAILTRLAIETAEVGRGGAIKFVFLWGDVTKNYFSIFRGNTFTWYQNYQSTSSNFEQGRS